MIRSISQRLKPPTHRDENHLNTMPPREKGNIVADLKIDDVERHQPLELQASHATYYEIPDVVDVNTAGQDSMTNIHHNGISDSGLAKHASTGHGNENSKAKDGYEKVSDRYEKPPYDASLENASNDVYTFMQYR